MKKLGTVFLSAAFLLSTLGACSASGQTAATTTTEAAATTAEATEAATSAETSAATSAATSEAATTEATAGEEDVSTVATTADTAEVVRTPIDKDKIIVGVIHITDPSEGSGYTYTHDVGIQEMQATLGLRDNQIIRKNNVDDSDPSACETAIRECIAEGANVIFATSWGYMDTVEAMAEEYPDVVFCHGTGYKSNDTNFSNYFGRIYQARYLSGIVAGMKTTTNKIGYVAAMGQDNSEVTGGIDAFAIGVESVNPDAKIYVKVTNSWFAPEEESNAAIALIGEGCDVIAQHCDTPNPQLAAEDAGVYGVGYNSDMSKDAPGAVLTSVVWNWGVYYTQAVQQVIDGTWTSDVYYGGMADGLVDISPLSDLVADGTAEKVEAARQAILDGSFNVFDGVLETNDGQTVGTEGGTLDDTTIKSGINWYYRNVVAD
ncbi:MAG: BMP family ABC transporter substrate-binding protein [Oscillospiraceae bacterium]|nr:BMP family ABC transporter substrate-binding protein [Oscillospiraceae bacterium]MDD4368825.1 BMP family ABC transporter substrate-binding protein [Oscillospiraceae bacterium]